MFLRRHSTSSFSPLLIGSLSLLLAVLLWEVIARMSDLPAFILPSPAEVAARFVRAVRAGMLFLHLWTTLSEILLGLLLGALFATILGYLIAHSPLLERLLSPYLVASQAVPMVALAPLLVIWFGPGMFSKVLICALIVFFPVLVNTVVGVRNIPRSFYELMDALRATRWQVLRYLELPAALPIFFGGLRVGATLSVIGAVVGELVGADRGLGFLINIGRGQYDTALVFASIFTLIALALILYATVLLLERWLIKGR
ncbi:MAG: ABC transporter permease [Chloroflexi bacterium]|nr:ABC transporter permease [Chloroflexota bacterium]